MRTHSLRLTLASSCIALGACQALPTIPQTEEPEMTSSAATAPRQHPEMLPVATLSKGPSAGQLWDKQELALPPPTDIWERIRRGFSLPPLDSPLAEQFARRYAANGYFSRTEARSRRYLYYIVQEFEKRGLPTELALLPFVESSLNPQAVSPVGATGHFQFMAPTGREFDLRISHLVDDRKNVMHATRAAMDYLQKLHTIFGDWHLALAGYNWGEGRVQTALARNRAQGLPADYLNIRMPVETSNYVPMLEALRRIVADPELFGVRLPMIPSEPFFTELPIEKDINLSTAIHYSGMPERDFLALNPSVKHPLVMAAATPILLLPHDAAARMNAGLTLHGSQTNWTAIRIGSTQRIEQIAATHGTSADTLRLANSIPPRMKAQAGSSLLVPATSSKERRVDDHLVENAALLLTPDVVRIQIAARKGETLINVARRLSLSNEQLRAWNPRVPAKRKLAAGQLLVAEVYADIASRLQKLAKPDRAEARNSKPHTVSVTSKTVAVKSRTHQKTRAIVSNRLPGKKS